jgi:long-chain acyl-CoA synthetase
MIETRLETCSSLADFFTLAVSWHPDTPLIWSNSPLEDRRLSYSDVYRLATALAIEVDFPPYSKIVLVGKLSPNWLIAFWAIILSDCIVVPLGETESLDEIKEKISFVDAAAVIIGNDCNNALIETLSSGAIAAQCLLLERIAANLVIDSLVEEGAKRKNGTAPDATAMIVYTSGTTGGYKAVMLTHRNILMDISYIITIFGTDCFAPGERTVPLLPAHHMFEVTVGLLAPLYYGITLCFSDAGAISSFSLFNVSYLAVVPEILNTFSRKLTMMGKNGVDAVSSDENRWRLEDDSHVDLKAGLVNRLLGNKIKLIICGGAAPDRLVLENCSIHGLNVLVGYGMTECSPVISCNTIERRRVQSVGIPQCDEYCSVKIDKGEILVKGSIVFAGYYGNPKATGAAMDNGWFRTGDLGYFDSDGFLYIVGRKDNLIVLESGEKVCPEVIESMVNESQAVTQSMVFPIKNSQKTILAIAVYPDYENEKINLLGIDSIISEQVEQVNKRLPAYMRIGIAEVLSEPISMSSVGKIKRHQSLQRESDVRVCNPIASVVLGILREHMEEHDKVIFSTSRLDFDLGLSSFDIVSISAVIEDEFGIALPQINALSTVVTVGNLINVVEDCIRQLDNGFDS